MFNKLKSIFKSADSIQWVFGNSTSPVNYNWTKQKGLNYYEISLYLNRALNKRADKVSEVNFILKDLKGDIVENEWTELLRRPNEYHSGDEFWKLYQKYKDIFGEVFIYVERDDGVFTKKRVPKSLTLLRPDLVEKVFNSDETEIIRFDYSPTSGNTISYSPEEIIYSFNPDPRYPLRGESLIRTGLRSIEVEIQANEYQSQSIKSGGNINTVIKVKDALNPEQLKEMRQEYRALRDELWKDGSPDEPMFAGGDMDILRLGLNPQELAYIDSKKMTLDDIVILTNTPKDVLGLTSQSTFANADASIKIFLRETIKPLLSDLTDVLNWKLIPDEYELDFIDPTPEDKEEKRKDLETADKVNALTLNEKRSILGLEPVKDGDVILVPINLIPFSTNQVNQEKSVKIKSHPINSEIKRRSYSKIYSSKLNDKSNSLNKHVQKFFNEQEERIVGYIESTKKRKNLISEGFNLTAEINLAKNSLLPVIRDIFIEQGEDHLQFLGSTEEFIFTSAMETSLQRRADLFSQSINQTTFDQLQRAFVLSADSGENRTQLVNRIRDVYGDISKGRAEVIARTETHVALQEANFSASKQAGFDMKIWVWNPGVQGGVRDEHLSIDGEERPINNPFSTGQQHPGDGSADQVINCECTVV